MKDFTWYDNDVSPKTYQTSFCFVSWNRKRFFAMFMKGLVQEFLFDCQVRNLAPSTIHNYDSQLKVFLKYLSKEFGIEELEQLKAIHIKKFVAMNQERGCKPQYVNDLLKAVKCLCAYAYQEGYTDDIITKRVKNVKEPRVLIHTFSADEIVKMIDYYNGSDYLSVRNRLMLMMLFDTGLRISEMIDMRPHQIGSCYFTIYGKGRKERVVPLSPILNKWMLKYERAKQVYFFNRCCLEEDYYFLSKNGRHLTCEAVNKMMKKAAAKVGINPLVRVSPHTCRHTFAHQELKNGLDLYSLSRLLGHESVSITQRYLDAIRDEQVLTSAKKTGVLEHL